MINHRVNVVRGELLIGHRLASDGQEPRYIVHIIEYDWTKHFETNEDTQVDVKLPPTTNIYNLVFKDKEFANKVFLALTENVEAPF